MHATGEGEKTKVKTHTALVQQTACTLGVCFVERTSDEVAPRSCAYGYDKVYVYAESEISNSIKSAESVARTVYI